MQKTATRNSDPTRNKGFSKTIEKSHNLGILPCQLQKKIALLQASFQIYRTLHIQIVHTVIGIPVNPKHP